MSLFCTASQYDIVHGRIQSESRSLLAVVFLVHAEKKSPVNKSSTVLKFPAGVEDGVSLGAALNC